LVFAGAGAGQEPSSHRGARSNKRQAREPPLVSCWRILYVACHVVRKGMTVHELKLDRYGEDKDWVLLECVLP